MPALLQDRSGDVHADGTSARGRRPSRRTRRRLVAAGIGLAVLVPLSAQLRDWLPGNPFGQDVVDRSTTPLLLALDDLHEYHAATGTFQVVVDREVDTRYVPSVISGERVTYLATGTADASVDFEGLDAERVTLSADGGSATIVLPAPRIGEVRIDPAESRVLDRDRGLVERVGDALADDPSADDPELFALAESRLAAAATGSDLVARAEDNTRSMLTTLAQSLGVDEVEVRFEEAPGSAG
jgi:hypothetical protein